MTVAQWLVIAGGVSMAAGVYGLFLPRNEEAADDFEARMVFLRRGARHGLMAASPFLVAAFGIVVYGVFFR